MMMSTNFKKTTFAILINPFETQQPLKLLQ